ncbi:MAG: DNA primase [Patescibacteria group bacterium]
MTDHVEQIKSRLDIVEVISGYLKLQKTGANYKARCPFHNEKTPSFHISTERQIWHCFGCSKGGDMFSFVQEIEGVDFPESLKILAHKAGVALEEFHPGTQERRDAKSKLYDICELASRFFEKQLLQSPTGQQALVYLRERGLADETIKQFRLGFAPDDWHALGEFLTGRGYATQEIINAGLAVAKEERHYDRFRSRITFPIADVNGRVVGFSGRVFSAKGAAPSGEQASEEEMGAKYINTPQTAIYDKGRILYGLDKAKMAVKQTNRCVLVEGNMDVVMSHQGGVAHAVAASGTALTPWQLRLLGRYPTTLDCCFDADQAGAQATRRGIGLALSQNFQVNMVPMSDKECKDPADYVQRYGMKWQEVASQAMPVIDFYFTRARSTMNPAAVADKKLLIATLAPLINRLVSRVERSHWVSQLAAFLRVKEEAVQADLAVAKDDLQVYEEREEPEAVTAATEGATVLAPAPTDIFSEALLSIVMKNPTLFRNEVASVDATLLDPTVAAMLKRLAMREEPVTNIDALIRDSAPEDRMRLEFANLRAQEEFGDMNDMELRTEFHKVANRVKQRSLLARLTELEFDIKQAEAANDKARMAGLVSQFVKLTEALATVHNA